MNRTSVRVSAHLRRESGWPVGAIAGLAGGAIEVGWIVLYQNMTGHQAAAVARSVTQSVIPQLAMAPAAVSLGVAIHMALAVGLGILIAILVRNLLPHVIGTPMEPVAVVAMLAGVWAMNFFVILPAINPAFVTLLPYGVSLTSKVFFGFAAAVVFWCAGRLHAAGQQGA